MTTVRKITMKGMAFTPSIARSAMLAWAAAPLAGCWLSNDEVIAKYNSPFPGEDTDISVSPDPSEDTDGSDELPSLVLQKVSPVGGTTIGNNEVVLTVAGLVGTPVVTFGESLGTIRSIDGNQVHVGAPPSAQEGWVSVEVRDQGRNSRLEQGYRYWPDGEGQVGAIGEVAYYAYAGDYWEGTPVNDGDASVRFMRPGNYSPRQIHGSSLDHCQSGYEEPYLSGLYHTGAASLTLTADAGPSITLQPNEDEYLGDFLEDSWSPGDDWTITMPEGLGWPELDIPAFLVTPAAFKLTSPPIDGAVVAEIAKNAFDLAWTGPYSGDYVVAQLFRFNGDEVEETVSCVIQDDGSFRVPQYVWSNWSAGSQITVVVGRAVLTEARLPVNRSNVGVAGVSYVVGAGVAK